MTLEGFEGKFRKEYASLSDNAKRKRESSQVDLLQESIQQTKKHHDITKKLTLVIASAVVAMVIIAGFFVMNIDNFQSGDFTGTNTLRTGYYVENLKGDTMDVSFSWRVPDNRQLSVEIINSEEYPDKTTLLKTAISSDKSIPTFNEQGDEVLSYEGWEGAINSLDIDKTEIYVPRNFEFLESGGVGDITITLSGLANGDGLSGITKISVDEAFKNQRSKGTPY